MSTTLFIDEVATYLATQLTLTIGTTLFVQNMPLVPEVATCVIDDGGMPATNTLTARRRVRLLLRHTDYNTGHAAADTALSKLHKKSGILGTTKTAWWIAESLPAYLGPNEHGLFLWSINFSVTVKTT